MRSFYALGVPPFQKKKKHTKDYHLYSYMFMIFILYLYIPLSGFAGLDTYDAIHRALGQGSQRGRVNGATLDMLMKMRRHG